MALTIRTTGIEDYLDGGEANVKALILGAPSAGKTRSASFWPKPIFADCEKGRMSIADRKMPYGEILSQADMKEFVRRLQMECLKPVRDRQFQTAVIDTFDSYQKIVIAERLKEQRKDSMSGWEDWGYLDTKMTGLLSALVALPMNLIINVHVKERSEGEDNKGPTYLMPRLKGDVRDSISEAFDLIGLMQVHWEAVNGERVLTRSVEWHPRPDVPLLKDRSGRLPKFTPVTFTEEDYTRLFIPLSEALDELEAGTTLETLETDADRAAEPVAPHTTGAVSQPAAGPVSPAKRVPAKKAAAPAVTPAAAVATPPAAAVPAAVKPVAAVPVAKRPTIEVVDANMPVPPTPAPEAETAGADPAPAADPAAAADVPAGVGPTTSVVEEPFVDTEAAGANVSDEQAVETAVAELGGTVTQESIHPDEDPPIEEPAATPVAAVPAPSFGKTCGTPGTNKGVLNDQPIPGCGVSLADIKPDLVNISLIKSTRAKRPTYLCPACMAAFTAAS